VLDEPLNGLDPLARAEAIELLRELARAGRAVVVSSHILHEVDELADRVVLIHGGYIVAEGAVEGVREEMIEERPAPGPGALRPALAARRGGFLEDHVVEARIDPDRRGSWCAPRTPSASSPARRLAAGGPVEIDAVLPADDDVQSVYQYLIGGDAQGSN
jgi:ABC-2 type transport system ATP-binding protein